MYVSARALVACGLVLSSVALGAEPLMLSQPQPHQVVQRIGVTPGKGFADVPIFGTLPAGAQHATWEYRIVVLADQPDQPAKTDSVSEWTGMIPTIAGNTFQAVARVPAGGWYRLECRCRVGDNVLAIGGVEPIGVGEVFVVAGQSYATNCNDERLTVADPQQRVVAFDSAKQTWAVANDPQPVFDGSDGGSIWPPLGDALAKEFGVPIGFANVAIGGSSSAQWLPEGNMLPRLISAGESLGSFRAVLWQQGESDVIAKNTTEGYVANIRTIRDTAAKAWGDSPPWLLAKSTHHPTVYNDPDGEGRIRAGIDELIKHPAFLAGPDTDTLTGDNRGDINSRRHFTGIGQRRAAEMWLASIRQELLTPKDQAAALQIGMAEVDITPPVGFPMAGYYHERLAEGTIDSLKAKAIVFREGETAGALVVCDLIGIATDLSREVRRRASEKTGIPASNIVLAATHSHTAPDYMKELWLYLGKAKQEPLRAEYIEKLISGPVDAIERAYGDAGNSLVSTGAALQTTPVAFNRRFVMRDGSVQTWQALSNPEVVRAAGPIDPRIELLAVRNSEDGKVRGILSNFALHLDTVGGMRWSADYPFFIEQTLRKNFGADVISIFGTGCCGDINHVNPSTPERNKADFIGESIGTSVCQQFPALSPIKKTQLHVMSQVVELPLEDVTQSEVERAIEIVALAKQGGNVAFLDHVTSYKQLILDQFLHRQPFTETSKHITWGLSRSLAGVGERIPVDVTVMTIGDDAAIVCLPGEVFVELGLAIKQASPFRTTIVVELSNAVETIYVPHRAAYAGGSYEVTNSALQPGGGEMLVEAAIKLLRHAAMENR
ncbi:MAG: neutral/alkaline non-lysosomal ceramidase N-terminal domain-containing protein [Planctomycetaceae bacterium]|nr:neutral/alkaline non-lysosomal ceramidase N-terminal domain-containing protein [Planctomycetaceae bacterium]